MRNLPQHGNDRVRNATPESINARIDRQLKDNIRYYSSAPQAEIKHRIEELDKEWDIERTLELNASVVALTGVVLAAATNKRWLVVPAIVSSFLALHALQGWCPPLPIFRNRKYRTQKEIEAERYALLALLKR